MSENLSGKRTILPGMISKTISKKTRKERKSLSEKFKGKDE